jgi:hypothetical protein
MEVSLRGRLKNLLRSESSHATVIIPLAKRRRLDLPQNLERERNNRFS